MYTSRPLYAFAALLLFLFSCTGIFAQQPVAWYPLNGNANDASGNGLHGSMYGPLPAADRFGNPVGALLFTAAERDHIAVGSCSALSFGTNDFTVTAWVKFCGMQSEYAGIVCKGPPNNSYPGYQLHIAGGDKFTTQIGDDRNRSDERRGKTALGDGRWHHVAVVVSPRRNMIEHYVDGKPVDSWTQVYTRRGNLNVSRFDPTILYIGAERNLDRFFNGVIDDVRLYDRTLTGGEMAALYHENGWTGEEPARGPVAWYPMDGNAADASGNGLHGIVYGATPTFDRFGACNSAYAFNGAERDYIAVRHSPMIAFGKKDFTVSAWVKFCRAEPEYAGIVCKGPPNNSYPGYQMHIADGNKFTTQIGDEGNWSDERRGKRGLNDGRWHMVTVAVSPRRNMVIQYVDGQAVTSWTQTYKQRGNLDVSRFDPVPLLIGTERNFDRFFTGIIDDVRLYDRELSSCEIVSLYQENGWTGEAAALPEPQIDITGPTAIRPWERTRLSIDCYPDVRWSTGETGPEITAIGPGIYSAVVSDGGGCNIRSVTVRIDDAAVNDSLLFSLELPGRCMGSAEQTYVTLPNPSDGRLVILGVRFPEGGEFVKFNTRFPIELLPGEEAELGFVYRWLTAGAQKTMVSIITYHREYRIELTSTGQPAYSPVFDRSRLAIEGYIDSNAVPFCVPVTNISGLDATITSASWAAPNAGFELVSPTLPFRVRPGETVQLCFRYLMPSVEAADNILVLGGEGMDRYGEYSECVAHRFRVRAGNGIRHGAGGEGDWVSAAGSDSFESVSGVEETVSAFAADATVDVYPNPAGTEATATFVLTRPGEITLELFDAGGRKVRNIVQSGSRAGAQQVAVNVEDLPAGLYMLRITSGNAIRTAPVIVRR